MAKGGSAGRKNSRSMRDGARTAREAEAHSNWSSLAFQA
jgi:hypothetical protein